VVLDLCLPVVCEDTVPERLGVQLVHLGVVEGAAPVKGDRISSQRLPLPRPPRRARRCRRA
jgi:hypothetical protein